MKCVVPVVMAGIIAIYGLVVSVLVSDGLAQTQALYTGFIQLGAGLSVGLAGLAAGFAIGIVGDAGVRGVAQQPRLFVGMILILIFSEVLGLYGLIVALLLNTKATEGMFFPGCCNRWLITHRRHLWLSSEDKRTTWIEIVHHEEVECAEIATFY